MGMLWCWKGELTLGKKDSVSSANILKDGLSNNKHKDSKHPQVISSAHMSAYL